MSDKKPPPRIVLGERYAGGKQSGENPAETQDELEKKKNKLGKKAPFVPNQKYVPYGVIQGPKPEECFGVGSAVSVKLTSTLVPRTVSRGMGIPSHPSYEKFPKPRVPAVVIVRPSPPTPAPVVKKEFPKKIEIKKAEPQTKRKKFAKIKIEMISWTPLPKPQYYFLNLRGVCDIIKYGRLDVDRGIHPPLYAEFLEHLKILIRREMTKEPTVRISLKAEGVFPGKRNEFGRLVKIGILNDDFVLPDSFFESCKSALIKQPF